jgi:hypothetical protein
MGTISRKYIVDYVTKTYGYLKFEPTQFTQSIRLVGNHFDVNKVDLFHFIIENNGAIPMTTSYGFQTAYGREIKETFSFVYNRLMGGASVSDVKELLRESVEI